MNGIAEHIHFNRTLMKEFRSYGEADRWAKKKNLECIGNENPRNIFKPKDDSKEIRAIAIEGVRRLRQEKIRNGVI